MAQTGGAGSASQVLRGGEGGGARRWDDEVTGACRARSTATGHPPLQLEEVQLAEEGACQCGWLYEREGETLDHLSGCKGDS